MMKEEMSAEERARERKKLFGGLVLGLIVLIWFIFQLYSMMPK